MAKIQLPNGNTLELADGVTAAQVAAEIGPGLAKAAIAAQINGQISDLSTPVTGDAAVQIITTKMIRASKFCDTVVRT